MSVELKLIGNDFTNNDGDDRHYGGTIERITNKPLLNHPPKLLESP